MSLDGLAQALMVTDTMIANNTLYGVDLSSVGVGTTGPAGMFFANSVIDQGLATNPGVGNTPAAIHLGGPVNPLSFQNVYFESPNVPVGNGNPGRILSLAFGGSASALVNVLRFSACYMNGNGGTSDYAMTLPTNVAQTFLMTVEDTRITGYSQADPIQNRLTTPPNNVALHHVYGPTAADYITSQSQWVG